MFHSFLIGFHWIGAPCIPMHPPTWCSHQCRENDSCQHGDADDALMVDALMARWANADPKCFKYMHMIITCTHALMLSCTHALMHSCSHVLMHSCSHALILTCTQDSNDHPMSFSSWPYGLPMAPPIFHMLYEYDTNMISNCSSWTLKPHEHQNQPITSDLKIWKKKLFPKWSISN